MMPTRLTSGTTRLMKATWRSATSLSDTPVTFVPEGAMDLTICAAMGSVMAL